MLQRGRRSVRRGRARRLRPDRGRPLLLCQRKTCRRASGHQGAARARRRSCAAAAGSSGQRQGLPPGARPHQRPAPAPRHVPTQSRARSWPRARARPLARRPQRRPARAEAATHIAPSRVSVYGRARRRGRRRVGLRKLWVTGSGRLSKIATGRRFPTAPPHVMCAPARPRGLPRGSACRRPGGAALPAQSQAQRRAAPTRGRARGGRKHARPPGDANPRQAPRERRRPPA